MKHKIIDAAKKYLLLAKEYGIKAIVFVKKILPNRNDKFEERVFKIIILAAAGSVAAMILIGSMTFVLSLEGKPQTLVPKVSGLPLADALLQLQEKELQGHVQLRFSGDPSTKGYVLEQSPAAGNLVRAGRSVNLTVSKGAVVDTVTDFVGQNLDDVRNYLRTISATYDPLMQIGNVSYVFSEEEPGTVLEQSPLPGTQLESLTNLDVVVSRGPDVQKMAVPKYVGRDYQSALEILVSQSRVFEFSFAEVQPDEDNPAGMVYAQSPAAGEEASASDRIFLEIVPEAATTRPTRGSRSNEVFGIFFQRLPEYPVFVDLTLQRINSEGEISTLFEAPHAGGVFAVPYRAEVGDVLVLSREENEISRILVTRQQSEE
ncbi:MAG: PASTA domain-containing protein [Spirochaetaceae bacterium]|nr:MAG: PASTA domain-containing protein [Spirochaetaceae bacterium]